MGHPIAVARMTMKYRPEIDGLRAVAVVPVVLFHAGVPGVTGGFVGVDVFFVISGYLITSILLSDLQAGRFSLAQFYERRARRILPALFFVILCCLPLAWAWMLPQELMDFGRSIAATALFSSNVLFWRETGYFSAASELKPLLHTWSLAVEEQYYLFAPLLIAVIWRWWRPTLLLCLSVIALASLALAVYGADHHPVANFYLLPFRIWELLAGAILAAVPAATLARAKGWQADFLGALGLAMIAAAIILFDDLTPTPGLSTLIPVVGAVLVLGFARSDGGVGRLLSLRPVVGMGLISYSLYLWHHPILAFARIRNIANPEGLLLWALLLGTAVLAWFTWRFVEQPFRGASPWLAGRWRLGAVSFAAMILSVGIGMALIVGDGFDGRVARGGHPYSDAASLVAALDANRGLSPECDAGEFTLSPRCRTSEEPVLALWGDSFAMHLAAALHNSISSVPFVQLTLSGCAPFPGLSDKASKSERAACIDFNDTALRWILSQDKIKTVVISSPFRHILSASLTTRDDHRFDSVEERKAALVRSATELGRALAIAGKKLVIVSPPPATGMDLGLCPIRMHLNGVAGAACDFPIGKHWSGSALAIELVKSLESVAPVVWLDDYLCTNGTCRVTLDGTPIYRDADHLSNAGSAELGRRVDLAGAIRAAAATRPPEEGPATR